MEPSSVTENLIQHRLKAALEALDLQLEDEIEQYRAQAPSAGSPPPIPVVTPIATPMPAAPVPAAAEVPVAVPKLTPPPPPPMFNRSAALSTPVPSTPVPTAAAANIPTVNLSTNLSTTGAPPLAPAPVAPASAATPTATNLNLLGGENFAQLPDFELPSSPFAADLAEPEDLGELADLGDLPDVDNLSTLTAADQPLQPLGGHTTQRELSPLQSEDNSRDQDLRTLVRPLSSEDLLEPEAALPDSLPATAETQLSDPAPQPGWWRLLLSRAGILTLLGTSLLGLGLWAMTRLNSRPQPTLANSPASSPTDASSPIALSPSPSPVLPNAAAPNGTSPSPNTANSANPLATPVQPSPTGTTQVANTPDAQPTGSSPANLPSPNASASSPTTAASSPSPSPSPSQVLGMTRTQTTSPSPVPSPNSFPVEPQPVSNYSYYYVVVSTYTKPQDYQKATQIISDAYLVRQGQDVKIQYAVFDSKETAQELVANLKRQGITATLQPPTAP